MDNVHFSLRPGTTYTMACEAVSVYALTVTVVTQEGEAVETFTLQPGESRQWAGDYTHLILSAAGDAVWSIVPVTRASAPCWHSRPITAPGVTVDTQYNPASINPQSGTAVAQAIGSIEVPSVTVDASYNPESSNPQSGTAVADALTDWVGATLATPTGNEASNAHYIELDAQHVPTGRLESISIQARPSGGNPSTYSHLGLWEQEDNGDWAYRGSSANAPGQAAGAAAVWNFAGVTLHGRRLRILPQASPSNNFATGPTLGLCAKVSPSGDTSKYVYNNTDYAYLPQLTISYAAPIPAYAAYGRVEAASWWQNSADCPFFPPAEAFVNGGVLYFDEDLKEHGYEFIVNEMVNNAPDEDMFLTVIIRWGQFASAAEGDPYIHSYGATYLTLYKPAKVGDAAPDYSVGKLFIRKSGNNPQYISVWENYYVRT